MITLVLHGSLRRQFGESFNINVPNPAAAIRLMEANFPGRFAEAMYNKVWAVTTAANSSGCRSVEELHCGVRPSSEVHIRPIPAGGIKGLFGLLLGGGALGGGVAPLGLGGAFGAGAGGLGIFGAGAGGAFGGFGSIFLGLAVVGVLMLISSALAPKDAAESNGPDERPSFLFDGATNVTEQGGPVPVVYGRIRVGSVLIAGALTTVEVPA